MNLEDLVGEVGFATAVYLLEEKLNPEFYEGLSFEEWINIYRNSPEGSKIEKIAQGKILAKAQNIEQWSKIYACDDNLKEIAINVMQTLAQSFDDWLVLAKIKNASFINQAKTLAKTFEDWENLYNLEKEKNEFNGNFGHYLEKMIELAECFEQFSKVFSYAWDYHNRYYSQRKMIVEKMTQYAKTFDNWCKITSASDEYKLTDIYLTAFNKAVKLARKIDDWAKLGRIATDNHLPFEQRYKLQDKFIETFNKKTENYHFSPEEMVSVYVNIRFLRLHLEKLIKESKNNLVFWFSLYEKMINGDCLGLHWDDRPQFKEIIYEAIVQSEADFDQWYIVYSRSSRNSSQTILEFSFKRMISLASTLEDWIKIYKTGKDRNTALTKMKRLAQETVEI